MDLVTNEDERPMKREDTSVVQTLEYIEEENAFWYYHPSNKKYKLNIPEERQRGNIRYQCKVLGMRLQLGPGFECLSPCFIMGFILSMGIMALYLGSCHDSITHFNKVGWFLLLSVLIVIFLMSYRDPGYCTRQPNREEIEENIHSFKCLRCFTYQDDKVEHCFDCDLCVKEYDHHCPVLGNCIAQKNIWCFRVFPCLFIMMFIGAYLSFFLRIKYCVSNKDNEPKLFL